MPSKHTQYTFLVTVSVPIGKSVPQLRQSIDNAIRLYPYSENLEPLVRRADRHSVSALLSKLTQAWKSSYEFSRRR